jgi:hypothetical protein
VAQTDDTIFISKIDTSGFEVFTKEIILNSSERIVGFHTFDKSGNLLICGKFWGDCTFLGKDHSIVLINNRMECCASGCSATCPSAVAYIAKFDTTGNIIWAYDFKTDSPYPNNIETTVDGTIFMEGILNFSADFDHSENVAALTNSGHSHYIAKYDSSCNFISASQFMGSSYNERVVNFKLYKDSIALMCGYFRGTMDLDLTNDYLPLSSNSSEDIFLAKYSHFDIHDYTYNSIKLEKQTDVIRIFPNPARLSFQIKNPSKYDIENISIYNIEGQIVRSIEYQYSRDLIDISQLNNGIYFIRLKLDNKILSYKLVKLD